MGNQQPNSEQEEVQRLSLYESTYSSYWGMEAVDIHIYITKYGCGADKFLEEANKGKGMKISPKLIGYFKYALTVLIIVILISGLIKQLYWH